MENYTLDSIYISNGSYDLFSLAESFSDKVFAIGEIPVVTIGEYEITTTSIYGKKRIKIIAYNGSEVNLTIPDQLTYIYPAGIPFERVQALDAKEIGEYSFLNNVSIISLIITDIIIVVGEKIAGNNIEVLTIGNSVKEFGRCSFCICENLVKIYFNACNTLQRLLL